jgi:hypothetical protein
MLDHHSHVRIQAKRQALDALSSKPSTGGQVSTKRYDTNDDTNAVVTPALNSHVTEKNGGDDETRTRDLCRDRREVHHRRKQNQQVRRAVVGNRWVHRDALEHFVQRFVQRPW